MSVHELQCTKSIVLSGFAQYDKFVATLGMTFNEKTDCQLRFKNVPYCLMCQKSLSCLCSKIILYHVYKERIYGTQNTNYFVFTLYICLNY